MHYCFQYDIICFNIRIFFQSQLSHGASFHYGGGGGGPGGGGGGGRPDYSIGGTPQRSLHEDPLALHQALGQAVDEAQQAAMDEQSGFISDLPLLKSELIILLNK